MNVYVGPCLQVFAKKFVLSTLSGYNIISILLQYDELSPSG